MSGEIIMGIKIWILIAFVPVVWWIVRWGINRIVTKLDEIIVQNAKFQSELVRQNGEISNLKSKVKSLVHKQEDHARRIRSLEIGETFNYSKP